MKYNSLNYVFLQIFFLIVTSSCGTVSTYERDSIHKPIVGIIGKWKLQSIKSVGELSLTDMLAFQEDITLEINDEYRLHGYAGCNSFFGKVKMEGSIIEFSSFISTSVGGLDKQHIEKIVLDALGNTNNYERVGNMLYLKHDKGTLAVYMATE